MDAVLFWSAILLTAAKLEKDETGLWGLVMLSVVFFPLYIAAVMATGLI